MSSQLKRLSLAALSISSLYLYHRSLPKSSYFPGEPSQCEEKGFQEEGPSERRLNLKLRMKHMLQKGKVSDQKEPIELEAKESNYAKEMIRTMKKIEKVQSEHALVKVQKEMEKREGMRAKRMEKKRHRRYHAVLTDLYMVLYRDLNAFTYDYQEERKQMLDKELFEGLRHFWEVHQSIKIEEEGKLWNRESRGYRNFRGLSNKFEEQLSRALASLAYSVSRPELEIHVGKDNVDWVVGLLGQWGQESGKSELRHLCSNKFLHNLRAHEKNSVKVPDAVLPISLIINQGRDENLEKAAEKLSNYDVDVIFIPGLASHPLKSWRMYIPGEQLRTPPDGKTWIKEYLEQDLAELAPGTKARLTCVGYESKFTHELLSNFNIRNRNTQEIAQELAHQFKDYGIGQKPLILIAYSMGGIVTKSMLLEDQALAGATMGILFVAVPHYGSSVVDDTLVYMNRAMQGFLPFLENSHNAIHANEIHENVVGHVNLTKAVMELCDNNILPKVEEHDSFLRLKIPFECIAEGQQVFFPQTGMKYTVVKPFSALPSGADSLRILEDKNHYELQKVASSKDDESYQVFLQYLLRQFQRL